MFNLNTYRSGDAIEFRRDVYWEKADRIVAESTLENYVIIEYRTVDVVRVRLCHLRDIRKAPSQPKRYRVAKMKHTTGDNTYTTTADGSKGAEYTEESPNFVEWLTGWVEYK